jgi:hypothetical protein
MSSFRTFLDNTRMRYDFDDQIQVRYTPSDGLNYDTWVSGEEVIHRLQSQDAEEKLRGLNDLDWAYLQELKDALPDLGRDALEESLINRVADELQDFIGGNIIGDSLAEAVRAKASGHRDDVNVAAVWKTLLEDNRFRLQVLTLAWIQLRGSYPESDTAPEPDDWI